jgi:hypothetical protein
VTGTLDANSAPHNVLVVRVYSGATEFGPVANPPLKNGGSFAYWHATYHLDGYDLGATSAPPFGARQGTFGVPQNPPGVTGTTFRAFLLEDWLPSTGNGRSGSTARSPDSRRPDRPNTGCAACRSDP